MAGGMLRAAQTPLEPWKLLVGLAARHCNALTTMHALHALQAPLKGWLKEVRENDWACSLAYLPWVFPGSEQSQGECSVVPDGRVWQCRWGWVPRR